MRSAEYHRYRTGGSVADPEHRDSGSLLTLSVLLCHPDDYTGGEFTCWSAASDGPSEVGARTARKGAEPTLRTPVLERGSGVLFVSEKRHNVLPVASGERRSLVIEVWDRPPNTFNRWR